MNILELNHVQYILEEKRILNHISLEIQQGDCISIVGPSGGGKSTLLRLCADLLSPTAGEICFLSKPYHQYDPLQLRKEISYCVQSGVLFGKTVRDNLEFPFVARKEKTDIQQINYWLKELALGKDFLDKDIQSLSGGEQQRIALIRTLLYRPKVLLLDEVTSALDPATTELVEARIKKENEQGVTVIWITHDIQQSQGIFNKRITISQGTIEKIEVL